jgi:rhamnogalacturonan II specific xylosyltransferase
MNCLVYAATNSPQWTMFILALCMPAIIYGGSNPSNGALVLLTQVSCNFTDMFENWFVSVGRVGLEDHVSVIAEDQIAYDWITRKFPTVHVVLTSFETKILDTKCSYDENVYKAVVVRRGNYIAKYLHHGVSVLYSDVDVVVQHDPMSYFNDAACDIFAQMDGVNYACTGFMYFRASPVTARLCSEWTASLLRNWAWNQPRFNELLHKNPIKLCPLDQTLFPSGATFFGEEANGPPRPGLTATQRRSAIVVHNNFIGGHDAKVTRFKEHGLWIL